MLLRKLNQEAHVKYRELSLAHNKNKAFLAIKALSSTLYFYAYDFNYNL